MDKFCKGVEPHVIGRDPTIHEHEWGRASGGVSGGAVCIENKYGSQSDCSSTYDLRSCNKVRLKCSTIPSLWEWYAVVRDFLTPNASKVKLG